MLVRRPPPRALTASLLRRAQRGYTAADVEVARKAIAARRPQPEATDSTRVLYSPRVRRTFADIVTGRWRGHPIDLNHSHEDWARRESSDRHIRHVLTTFRSATFRRLLYPDLAVTTSISASVVLHNLLVAWEHEHTMTVESIERHGFDLLLHHEMITLPVQLLTQKHNPGPKTHTHRQPRISNDSQKSAPGPGNSPFTVLSVAPTTA